MRNKKSCNSSARFIYREHETQVVLAAYISCSRERTNNNSCNSCARLTGVIARAHDVRSRAHELQELLFVRMTSYARDTISRPHDLQDFVLFRMSLFGFRRLRIQRTRDDPVFV